MSYIMNSKNFSQWNFGPTGSGSVSSQSDGRLRMQNTDATSRALVYRDVMLMAGDVVTIYGIGKTTSLSSGQFMMGIEYPIGTRKSLAYYNHNEDSLLLKCSWKVPVDWGPTSVRIWCGLPSNTVAIAYITDLWFTIDSENLGSRRVLMDGVLEIASGVSSLSTVYDSSNVGTISAASINVDISPLSFSAGNRRPIAFLQPIFNTSETYASGVLVPVGNFTSGGVLNIRLVNPTTGSAVGVTGSGINKTIAFTVYI